MKTMFFENESERKALLSGQNSNNSIRKKIGKAAFSYGSIAVLLTVLFLISDFYTKDSNEKKTLRSYEIVFGVSALLAFLICAATTYPECRSACKKKVSNVTENELEKEPKIYNL